ncbi:acyl-CoA reductase [Telluribacter humicola]|uniref:acyl-CoA reductase n=1 Tax=Telluribacter humicola TaxID=1720261 RepID=UPI001A9707F0|nr:acyl-CoA reductase [Telluribacter humicola]
MISRTTRYKSFAKLGEYLRDPANELLLEDWAFRAHLTNNWFTPDNVMNSLKAIGEQYLTEDELQKWADTYPEPAASKKIGVVMAGNVPAVGFHDAMAVLISGHVLLAKLSTDDTVLIKFLLDKLSLIEPAFRESIHFVERLNDADAYIATGSDNTARYFEYYFSKKPNIIRRNRVSVALLTGKESREELAALGSDILRYYGLGCRNVAKLYVPLGYDFVPFFEAIQPFEEYCRNHHKFFNNYEYNKSILLVNGTPHFDNGFLMAVENPALVSPLSVVNYETFQDLAEVKARLAEDQDKIQCVVGKPETSVASLPFGQAQKPGLSDYADGVDTMEFLSKL